MGWLYTRKRLLRPDKIRIIFLLIAIISFVFTEWGRFIYRPIIYSQGINDFGLADNIGNIGGIIVQIFLGCAIANPTKIQSYRLAAFCSVGYIVYEFLQPYLPKGIFDWNDVVGTLFGLLFAIIILWTIWFIDSIINKNEKAN